VLLSGEPGIGKSRLTAALLERVASEPHTRLRYFCSPQPSDSALFPIIGQMERAARFAHDDTGRAKLDKLDDRFVRPHAARGNAGLPRDRSQEGDGKIAAGRGPDRAPQVLFHRRRAQALRDQLCQYCWRLCHQLRHRQTRDAAEPDHQRHFDFCGHSSRGNPSLWLAFRPDWPQEDVLCKLRVRDRFCLPDVWASEHEGSVDHHVDDHCGHYLRANCGLQRRRAMVFRTFLGKIAIQWRFARLPDWRRNQRRLTPFAAATFMAWTGGATWPISVYLIVLALITFVATMAAPEMAGKALK
jgi:hypothetical protein